MLNPQDIARRAKELQEDAVVQHILAHLENKYISEWRNTAPADIQKRENAFAGIRMLEDFKVRLQSLANAPKIEAHNNRNAARR